jgi:hypothetical protein
MLPTVNDGDTRIIFFQGNDQLDGTEQPCPIACPPSLAVGLPVIVSG